MENSDDFRERYTRKTFKEAYAEEFESAPNVTIRRIFKASEEDIANELVRLSLHAEGERTRLAACTTITEHLIGKPRSADSEGDALSDALAKIKAMPLKPNTPTTYPIQKVPVFKPTSHHKPTTEEETPFDPDSIP